MLAAPFKDAELLVLYMWCCVYSVLAAPCKGKGGLVVCPHGVAVPKLLLLMLSEECIIIQIWHLGECNTNCYCTLKNDIAQGACAECNIIFQSAIKIDIARNQSAIFVLLYAYCSF